MTESLEEEVRLAIREIITALSEKYTSKEGVSSINISYSPGDSLENIGFDSIDAASLLVEIEDKFGVNFDNACKSRQEKDNPIKRRAFLDDYCSKLSENEIVKYVVEQKEGVRAASSTAV